MKHDFVLTFNQTRRGTHTKAQQWRIQDFPKGDIKPRRQTPNLLFGKVFAENCMKMKEIELRRRRASLWAATAQNNKTSVTKGKVLGKYGLQNLTTKLCTLWNVHFIVTGIKLDLPLKDQNYYKEYAIVFWEFHQYCVFPISCIGKIIAIKSVTKSALIAQIIFTTFKMK